MSQGGGCAPGTPDRAPDDSLRVVSYNLGDVRTRAVRQSRDPRLRRLAARIQELAPDILLVNELAYDQSGAPGYETGAPEGQNARRFAERYLAHPQADTLNGLSYKSVMLPVNSGSPSGYDLNNDGTIERHPPTTSSVSFDGRGRHRASAAQAYGEDAWGFGGFPGQYGMALFVRSDLQVLRDSIRTFRRFLWSQMPGASRPRDTSRGDPWDTEEEWLHRRLSSRSHWDIPVRVPNGSVVHVLASHPVPPRFDEQAQRNARRNHDEIRLWVDYLNGRAYIEDDSDRDGGLGPETSFLVMGTLNADPKDESRFRDAVRTLLAHPRVADPRPTASAAGRAAFPTLDPEDTVRWGKRVDYVLPSADLAVDARGVWRPGTDTTAMPVSDHFPVWVDVRVPSSAR